jgi:UDP-N-acetylglucosamine acyltransferase
MTRKGYSESDVEIVGSAYSNGRLPDLAALNETTATAFEWWRNLSTKPLIR